MSPSLSGGGAPETLAGGLTVRPAGREEIPLLAAIEDAAGERFREIAGLEDQPSDPSPVEELEAACEIGWLWVATTPLEGGEREERKERIVGLLYAAPVDDHLHVEEVSVLPDAGRRGVGTALVRAALAQAVAEGRGAVTLTTDRDVPWNAPWYRKLGFVEIPEPEWGPELEAAVASERERGFDWSRRLAMIWRPERNPTGAAGVVCREEARR